MRYRIELDIETSAFIPQSDIYGIPNADDFFRTMMEDYEKDEDRRIVAFRITKGHEPSAELLRSSGRPS